MEHLIRISDGNSCTEFLMGESGIVISSTEYGDCGQIEQSIIVNMKQEEAEYLADFLSKRMFKNNECT